MNPPAPSSATSIEAFEARAPRVGALALCFALASTACGGSGTEGGPGGGTASNADLKHTFERIEVGVGEELMNVCQSWTLDNDEELFITEIAQENDGGWHHSNWFFVPETLYEGPDGTWPCKDRAFSETEAGLEGGVLFAQSTQSETDIQTFPAGMGLRIPARSRVVGNVHLLNTSAAALDTALAFEITTAPADTIETPLFPLTVTNVALDLEPNAASQFTARCDLGTPFRDRFDRDPDFRIVYVLPHYHSLGRQFSLVASEDGANPRTVFETAAAVGDPSGATLDPPFAMEGATHVELTCGYENPHSRRIGYGFGDAEMCVFLAYIDAPMKIVGTAATNTPLGPDDDGVYQNESNCGVIAF